MVFIPGPRFARANRTPGKYPKEYIHDSKHGESLKSRNTNYCEYSIKTPDDGQ